MTDRLCIPRWRVSLPTVIYHAGGDSNAPICAREYWLSGCLREAHRMNPDGQVPLSDEKLEQTTCRPDLRMPVRPWCSFVGFDSVQYALPKFRPLVGESME